MFLILYLFFHASLCFAQDNPKKTSPKIKQVGYIGDIGLRFESGIGVLSSTLSEDGMISSIFGQERSSFYIWAEYNYFFRSRTSFAVSFLFDLDLSPSQTLFFSWHLGLGIRHTFYSHPRINLYFAGHILLNLMTANQFTLRLDRLFLMPTIGAIFPLDETKQFQLFLTFKAPVKFIPFHTQPFELFPFFSVGFDVGLGLQILF